MPDLPKPGSEWIRRSKLDEWTVWNSGPDGVYLRNIDGGSIGVRAENFHRDFIENGPVTLERLEACGWKLNGTVASLWVTETTVLEWHANTGMMAATDYLDFGQCYC